MTGVAIVRVWSPVDPEPSHIDPTSEDVDPESRSGNLSRVPLEPSNRAVGIALWAMLSVAVLVLLGTVPVVYLAVSPLECSSCHNDTAFVAVTKASAHADSDCVSCHAGADALARMEFGYRQAYGMLIPVSSAAVRDAGAAYDIRCTACHTEGLGGSVNRNGISVDHSRCTVGRACLDCHGGVAHGDTTGVWIDSYTMDLCLECHSADAARRSCDTCHDGDRAGSRPVYSSFQITHGPDWERTHGMGNGKTCGACHEPSKCASCHGVGVPHPIGFYDQHGDFAKDASANCTSCHQVSFCTDCHGVYEMPHPEDFAKSHSAIVDKAGDADCLRCHTRNDCDSCHAAHVHPGGSIGLGGTL